MRIVKIIGKLWCCYLLLWGSGANATAFSFADVFVDVDSISITGLNPNDVIVGDIELDSFVELSNESGSFFSSDVGGETLFNSVFGLNADAFTDGLAASTLSNSVAGDVNAASSSAELSILVPFTSYSADGFDVFVNYELFASIDTENSGDFSVATSSIEYRLLDSNFELTGDLFTDDVLAIGFDGLGEADASAGVLGFDYSGFAAGSYYVAINVFASSFTETIVTNVPAPGTLFLMVLGLIALMSKKIFYKQLASSPQLASHA